MTNTETATLNPRHAEILRSVDSRGEIEASRDVPFQTLKAMERRGLVTIRTRVQDAIHTRREVYRVARVTDAGRAALATVLAPPVSAARPRPVAERVAELYPDADA